MNRREFLIRACAAATATSLAGRVAFSQATQPAASDMIKRAIPSTGETIPVIGMGTWQTFNVRDLDDPSKLAPLEEVLKLFYAAGGRVIDSSPMYGSAEEVTGLLTDKLGMNRDLFFATKVWTQGKDPGIKQMETSLARFRRQKLELMQVHNLVDWQTQLATLRDWKQQGRFKYIGVTHYSPSQFDTLEQIVKNEKIDFVQLPYSITVRAVEQRLLPAAKDNGVAVLVMRPLEGGNLFGKVKGKSLPDSVKPYAGSWAQAFLKFVVSHPAVTCAIPATNKPEHMSDNLLAGSGRLPDDKEREELARIVS
jgi:diketogulonate reductase-like aldo/keto reductase